MTYIALAISCFALGYVLGVTMFEKEGVTMFEKEAKEEINKEHWNYSIFKDLAQEYWQKGAEYGYNKALEETTHNYNAIIADYDKRIAELTKANKWHYVKDGVFPKKDCLVYYKDAMGNFSYSFVHPSHYIAGVESFFEANPQIIAWKEIVLPKEIKENE